MKQTVQFLKMFVAFFLLAVSFFAFWSIHNSKDIPDRAVWIMLVSFGVSLAILWEDAARKFKR
jgi:tellurite resistance protein TehA-like permease